MSGVPRRATLSTGVEVHFVDEGCGPAVILLHGGMGDAGSWPHQLRTLPARHRVIAYSRRHSSPNRNPDPGDSHRLDDDVEDLLALQDALHTGRAHLVGSSYGALVALAFAVLHPAHVQSLVLVEPPLHRWACATVAGAHLCEAFIEQVWHPAADAFAQGQERRAMQLLANGIWGRPTFDTWPAERVESALRNAAAMKALTLSHDPFPCLNRHAVARLAAPTLLIQGANASALHRLVMDELAREMSNARRVEIAGTGHGCVNEKPDVFDAAIHAFFASLPAAPLTPPSAPGSRG